MVEAQEGDSAYIKNLDLFEKAGHSLEIKADKEGYIQEMDTEKCGIASVVLGAGRKTMDSKIDYAAGIKIKKKTADQVKKGDTLAILYTNRAESLEEAEKIYREAIKISAEKVNPRRQILARVEKDYVSRY